KGQEFRKGLGVSGRMADFLDNDPRRIAQAFDILLSMPGVPIIYYGDEIAARNNQKYARQAALERETAQRKLNKDLQVLSFEDSRDINRGPVEKRRFEQAAQTTGTTPGLVFHHVQRDLRLRRNTIALRRGNFSRIGSDRAGLFAYLRSTPRQTLLVVN